MLTLSRIRNFTAGILILPQLLIAQDQGSLTQQEAAFIPVSPQENIKDQLQDWIEIADDVLFNKKFKYKDSGLRNRAYALIDLRIKFLTTLIQMAKLELVNPRDCKHPQSCRSLDESKTAFYDAMTRAFDNYNCFIPKDFRDYRNDSFIHGYETIRQCFRQGIDSPQGVKDEIGLSIKAASEAGITGDIFAKSVSDFLSLSLSSFDRDLRNTDFLYPNSDGKNPNREEIIHLIEHHMLENMNFFLDSMIRAVSKNQVWSIVLNNERLSNRRTEIGETLLGFARSGGPSYQAPSTAINRESEEREITDLEMDVLGLLNISEGILAGG
ncbi:MAG: hypothetical protein COV44_00250 [Deltaproteobacteria bacterium CG11_big_fil_rev_8_21_14_0_20_45_16]|nr:MAG: hypothetical protein COV44_00250 [Deltaproteobacteria bacterium CG11_big_fil_rev_8_21_14_0_20_45_16]